MPNYIRAFAGKSSRWDDKSVATVVPHPGGNVEGLAVKMTPEQVQIIDGYEGNGAVYQRTDCQLILYSGGVQQLAKGQTYIKLDLSFYTRPGERYLTACAKTVRNSRQLRELPSDKVEIDVVRAKDVFFKKPFVCDFNSETSSN